MELFLKPELIVMIIVMIVLIITVFLPDKYDFFLSSLIMAMIGGLQLGDHYGFFSISYAQSPVFDFAAIFILTYAARDLVYEGVKGNKGYLKIFLLISGLLILILTSIPILYDYNLLNFDFKMNYIESTIKSGFYFLSGVIMLIASFLMLDGY